MSSTERATRRRPSPALMIAVAALAAALAGTAVADPTGSASAVSKRKVKRIAKKQVNKLAPGLSVAHADSANSAGTADTAKSAGIANVAANADKLDGQDASAFAAASEVHTPVRRVVNDAAPGDPFVNTVVDLAVAGPFTFKGACTKNNQLGQDEAGVRLEGPAGSAITAVRTVGGEVTEPGTTSAVAAGVIASGNAVEGGHFVAVARNGQVVSGNASAEVGDAAGHCIFGLTALGP